MKSAGTGTDKMASVRAAGIAKRIAAKGQRGVPLTAEQVEKRERCFVIYRDFGKSRTIHKLHRVLSEEHPHLLMSKVTLQKWCKRHNWVERTEAFDRGIVMAQLLPPVLMKPSVNPEFNSVDALLAAAQMALTKAMNANPVVTRPGDVKVLVDAAANAMKLVETLEHKQAGKGAANEIAADIERICGLVEAARRRDIDEICRVVARTAADMSGQPIEPILTAAMNSAGLYEQLKAATISPVSTDAILDADPELIEADEAAEAPKNELSTGASVASFTDVLAQFRRGI